MFHHVGHQPWLKPSCEEKQRQQKQCTTYFGCSLFPSVGSSSGTSTFCISSFTTYMNLLSSRSLYLLPGNSIFNILSTIPLLLMSKPSQGCLLVSKPLSLIVPVILISNPFYPGHTQWITKQNKTKNPSADTCSTLKARSINIGYQHGHSQTTATHTKKKQTWQQMACCAIYTQNTKIKWQVRLGERETQRLANLLLAILDRSAVAMATSSPRLVFGAAFGITAEDLMFSTHLGSANMALQSATPLLATYWTRNPLFRTQRLASEPPASKYLTECQINQQFCSSWQMFLLQRTMSSLQTFKISMCCASLIWICLFA